MESLNNRAIVGNDRKVSAHVQLPDDKMCAQRFHCLTCPRLARLDRPLADKTEANEAAPISTLGTDTTVALAPQEASNITGR